MKSTLRCFLLLLVSLGKPVVAQRVPSQPDSLSVSDTIHLRKRWVLFSRVREYSYHYASNLTDLQLMPMLRQSADSTVRRYAGRGQKAQFVHTGMYATGYALMAAGLFTPVRRPETNLSMMTGGLGLFYGSLIPMGKRAKQLERAVQTHNRRLRIQPDDYFVPVVNASMRQASLSLADTVALLRRGLANRYRYRGVWVEPAQQLTRLSDQLNDRDVRNGFQYTRRVNSIAGLFTGLGLSYLVPRLLIYGLSQANGRPALLGSPVLWTATAVTTIGAGMGYHARQVQQQTTRLLNERLRDQDNPARAAEHFQNP